MAYINLELPPGEIACVGKQVTFTTPCDCTNLDGIVVDGVYYALKDARGNAVTSTSNWFKSGVLITVVLDPISNTAFIQNAAQPTIRVGTTPPSNSLGVDGDIYIQIVES